MLWRAFLGAGYDWKRAVDGDIAATFASYGHPLGSGKPQGMAASRLSDIRLEDNILEYWGDRITAHFRVGLSSLER